jgi:IS1 family transposase
MNRLSLKARAQVIRCLVDGNSVRATTRITDVSIPTILKLLADVGAACSAYQDEHLRGLTCERIQCDEAWSFVYSKAKNVPEKYRGVFGYGDVWLWTAICADCKLIPSWYLGTRDAGAATVFMRDLSSRLSNRIQLTTDGHHAYLIAVDRAFGWAFRENSIDYAMLVKLYGKAQDGPETRYSPAVCLGTKRNIIHGDPDPEHISTSYVERSNLTIRMGNRRYTRLTNAFSKKVENHSHHLALHFMCYNYARQHQTLRVSPAMQAGKSDHLWSVEEIAALAD